MHFSHLLWTGWGGDLNDLIFFYENVQKLRIHFILQELFIFAPTLCEILKAAGSNDIWMELSCGPFHVLFHNLKGFPECFKWSVWKKNRTLFVSTIWASTVGTPQVIWNEVTCWSRCPKQLSMWILCIKPNRSVLHLVLFDHFCKDEFRFRIF